jgi:hypothetical protein
MAEACSEKYRLISRDARPGQTFAAADDLPEALKTLIIKGSAIYERVRRLDETMYDGAPKPGTRSPISWLSSTPRSAAK